MKDHNPFERFDLPYPKTPGEHAEISHLLSFLREEVEKIVAGKASASSVLLDITLAYEELQKCLQDILNNYEKGRF